jgi:outer membrane protein TolC
MKAPVFLWMLFMQIVFLRITAQENTPLRLSVSEAREYAIANNRTVQSSRIDIGIAEKKIKENLASGFPQASVNANYLHQFQVPQISFGSFLDPESLPTGAVTGTDIRNAFRDAPTIPLGVRNNTTIDFTLSQLVFNGQYFVALKTARIVRELSGKNLLRTEDQIKSEIAVSYYVILVLQENLRLLRELMASLDKIYEETAAMNKQGLNEETDVDQVNINRSNMRASIASVETQTNIAVKQLKLLLGVNFDQPVELTDSLAGIINEGNLSYLSTPEFDVKNSIEFQLTKIQEDVSGRLLNLEKSKYLPTISAFYRHQEQTNQPAFNFAVKDVIGASLNFPLFASGMRSARVSQARYDLEKAKLTTLDTEMGLLMQYEVAMNNYRTAYSNFEINRESMALSRRVYDRTMIKFREGVSSSIELTQIQNQFLNSESNYYNSLLTLLRSKAELDRLLRIN